MESKLENLIEFIKFLEKFRQVKRVNYLVGSVEQENDVEHSYQMAMTAWYIIDIKKLSLDLKKVLKYCLAHDVIETYAGDTFAFTNNNNLRNSKKVREKDALERIRKEFPEFPELSQAIVDYENRSDEESKFVYAVDKLLPCLNTFIDDGKNWKDHEVTFEMWIERKRDKIASHPEIESYLLEMEPSIKEMFFKI